MEVEELKTGWLAPSGDFYPCCSYDHIMEARGFVAQFGIASSENGCPDDALMAAGWVYIGTSSIGLPEWRIGWRTFLTDYQKNFLKQYFEQTATPVNDVSVYRWKEENGLLDDL